MFIGSILRARRRSTSVVPPAELKFTPETSGLTPKQLATGIKTLQLLGLDIRHNQLSDGDLLCFLRAVGLNPTPDAVDTKLHMLKVPPTTDHFTWGQLTHIWSALLKDVADEEDVLIRAFEFFDKDGNGEISIAELRTTMTELGGLLSEQEIMEFVEIMDVNKDGAIGYQEFIQLLRSEGPAINLSEESPTSRNATSSGVQSFKEATLRDAAGWDPSSEESPGQAVLEAELASAWQKDDHCQPGRRVEPEADRDGQQQCLVVSEEDSSSEERSQLREGQGRHSEEGKQSGTRRRGGASSGAGFGDGVEAGAASVAGEVSELYLPGVPEIQQLQQVDEGHCGAAVQAARSAAKQKVLEREGRGAARAANGQQRSGSHPRAASALDMAADD